MLCAAEPDPALLFDFQLGFVGYLGYEMKAEMGGRASPMIVKRDPCSLRALPSSQNAPVRGRTVRKPGRGADDDRFFAIQGATSGGAARPRRTGVPRPLCGVGEPPVCCCENSSGFSLAIDSG